MTNDEEFLWHALGFIQRDNGLWVEISTALKDPIQRRRLVRTQIEELNSLYWHYPLKEFEGVRKLLAQLREAYSDVEPFDHPLSKWGSYDDGWEPDDESI